MSAALDSLNLPDNLRDALERAVERIIEASDPELIILFGSWADGRATEDSDVDLLVVAETETPYPTARALRRHARAAGLTGPVDLVVMPTGRWPDAKRIAGTAIWEADRFGVRLHERVA